MNIVQPLDDMIIIVVQSDLNLWTVDLKIGLPDEWTFAIVGTLYNSLYKNILILSKSRTRNGQTNRQTASLNKDSYGRPRNNYSYTVIYACCFNMNNRVQPKVIENCSLL